MPQRRAGLVFPNGIGRVESHGNLDDRGFQPAQIAAGVCTVAKDQDGKVVLDAKGTLVRKAKYTGLHAMRHFFAS